MKIRTVTSLREFDDLAGLWRDVTETSGQHSALLSHDWFACCWRTAGPNRVRELWIVEDAAGPVAFIPLVRARARYRGFPARVIQLMHPPESPIVDFPVARDIDDVMRTVLKRLGTQADWDLFLIPGLPTHSPVWKSFESVATSRFPWRVADRVQTPYVTFSDREPSLQATLDTLRQRITSTVARVGDAVTVEEHRALDPRGPLFDEIMGVVRDGARRPASLPAPTGEEVRRFFRELTSRASANGWLSLWILRLAGRVVETEYQLVSRGTAHALRRDADQSPAGLNLGDILTLKILESLARRPGLRTYLQTPERNADGIVPAAARQETFFIELFAARSYGNLLHRVESRVASVARRLRGEQGRPCA
jgi:hypothetical protein